MEEAEKQFSPPHPDKRKKEQPPKSPIEGGYWDRKLMEIKDKDKSR